MRLTWWYVSFCHIFQLFQGCLILHCKTIRMISDYLCNPPCPPTVLLPANPSYFLPLSHSLSLCQTVIWVIASQVTWESRRLCIPAQALHSGDSLPCLSPLPSFVFVHSWTATSNSLSRGLHFHALLFLVCHPSLSCNQGETSSVLKCSETVHYVALMA